MRKQLATILFILFLICFIIAVYYFVTQGFTALLSFLVVLITGLFVSILQVLLSMGRESASKELAPEDYHPLWTNKFKKDYLTLLQYQNRDFDLKGLRTQTRFALDLEQVYVDLRLQPQSPHLASADLLKTGPTDTQRRPQSIWDFLHSGEAREKGARLAVIGPPGSGKTTLLRHIVMILTAKDSERKRITSYYKLPILLYLRNHAQRIAENPRVHLWELVEEAVKTWDLPAPDNWFLKQLRDGRCIIMLDGLDEVAEAATRRKVAAWVEGQIKTHPGNSFVITSRPYGYRENPIGGVNLLEVLPFTREQIVRFVHNWYLANEIKSHGKVDDGVKMVARRGADELLQKLMKSQALMELAINPLLLMMISTVHRYRSSLPDKRVELYKEICEVFLGKRQQSKGLEIGLDPARKQSVLQPLAYHMMRTHVREIRIAEAAGIIREPLSLVQSGIVPLDFIKDIENQSGLFLERENGVYGFAHKTFQEYLASVYLLESAPDEKMMISEYIVDDWWHETIRLYAAQTDASEVILSCLHLDPPNALSLALAIQCADEGKKVRPEVVTYLENHLINKADDPDPENRHIVAETLLAHRMKSLLPLSPEITIDCKLLSNAEYQLFVDDTTYRKAVGPCPAHWKEDFFPPGTAYQPVLGVTYAQAKDFCSWLSQKMYISQECAIRLPLPAEIKALGTRFDFSFWMDTATFPRCYRGRKGWPVLESRVFMKMVGIDLKNLFLAIQHKNLAEIKGGGSFENFNDLLFTISRDRERREKAIMKNANDIYDKIIHTELNRCVDFGIPIPKEFETYDPTLSDLMDKKPELQDVVMTLIAAYRSLSYDFSPATNRMHMLYIALIYNIVLGMLSTGFFLHPGLEKLQHRQDQLIERYIDLTLHQARINGSLPPFEGILLARESCFKEEENGLWPGPVTG